MSMAITLILSYISKYISLDKTEADFFISLLEVRTVKRRDFLLKQGQICRYESFITKGCFRTYSIDDNGFEHIVL